MERGVKRMRINGTDNENQEGNHTDTLCNAGPQHLIGTTVLEAQHQVHGFKCSEVTVLEFLITYERKAWHFLFCTGSLKCCVCSCFTHASIHKGDGLSTPAPQPYPTREQRKVLQC